jgi:hypothetical protein
MADHYAHKLAETLRGLSDVDLAAYRSDKIRRFSSRIVSPTGRLISKDNALATAA